VVTNHGPGLDGPWLQRSVDWRRDPGHDPSDGTGQTLAVRALAGSGAGFLLAVLWFDLMFDIQVRARAGPELPASVRDSIATYYARVTTAARPMNRLIATVMLVTIGALVAQLFTDDLPAWRAALALALTVGAVGLAAVRTVGDAVRLGGQADGASEQSRLARSIFRDHLVCISAISAVLLLQLLPA
jgi:hypothetical protein